MKSPAEVLRMEEVELERVKKEIEALRLTAQILEEMQPEPLLRKTAKVVQLP
jgi:hypothetical protein